MDVKFLQAANAYQNPAKMMQGVATVADSSDTPAPAASFSSMVSEAMQHATKTMRQSEALQTQALTGSKVELSDLVTAVANAELTVNTVVAVRDRIISAYQDIIRMPI